MKPTNQNIADFYGLHVNTVSNFKNGTEAEKRRYEALKRYFLSEHNTIEKG